MQIIAVNYKRETLSMAKYLHKGKFSFLAVCFQFEELKMQNYDCYWNQPTAGTVIGNARTGTAEKFPLHFEEVVEHLTVGSGNENHLLKHTRNRKGICIKTVSIL